MIQLTRLSPVDLVDPVDCWDAQGPGAGHVGRVGKKRKGLEVRILYFLWTRRRYKHLGKWGQHVNTSTGDRTGPVVQLGHAAKGQMASGQVVVVVVN